MFEQINEFFYNLPRILINELDNNSPILKNLGNNEIIAGISYLYSIIYNKQITKSDNLITPNISKKRANELIKIFLKHIDSNIIKNYLESSVYLSEKEYNPIDTIEVYDNNNTIRVIGISDDLYDQIWNNLSNSARNNQKLKRYFLYRLDNPSLSTVLRCTSRGTCGINYLKGHGSSPIVKIPKAIDKDLAYILGALRDGGIHYDRNNDAYKIHFEQQEYQYLEDEIQPRLYKLFDLDTTIEPRPDGVNQIQFASKPLYILFSKCFGMREIQQFWKTPNLIENANLTIQKEYIKGFFDAEGTYEHIYHSWFHSTECPPLEFISHLLNSIEIHCTEPRLIKTSSEFKRFPAFQIYINDYKRFLREIMDL